MNKIKIILVASILSSFIQFPSYLLAQSGQGQTFEEIDILMMAQAYTKEYEGIKDRNSIQHQFKFIYTPEEFKEIPTIIRKLGSKYRIRKMVFLGHGDPDYSLALLSDDQGFLSTDLQALNQKFWDAGDTSLLDAFAENAEIIYFNCSVGKDMKFLKDTAEVFLAFSGGTVYGSDTLVKSEIGAEGRLIQWLTTLAFWNRDIGWDSVNFDSPSKIDYHKFRHYTLDPFPYRDFSAQTKVEIEGPDSADVNEKVTLRAMIPDLQSIPAGIRPFLKSEWLLRRTSMVNGVERAYIQLDKSGSKVLISDTAEPNTSEPTTCKAHVSLFLSNDIGRRILGAVDFSFPIGETMDLGIDLSVQNPEQGKSVTARAFLKKGNLPKGAIWGWRAESGLLVETRADDTIKFKANREGLLSVQLYTKVFDSLSMGRTRILGQVSILVTPKPGTPPPEEELPGDKAPDEELPGAAAGGEKGGKPAVVGGKEKPTGSTGSPAARSVSGTAEWACYHLKYTISGAALVTPPEYTAPFGFDVYNYTGELASDTLTVSGTGWSDNETSSDAFPYVLSVSVSAGGKSQTYEYKAPAKEKLNKSFSLSVPVPAGSNSGGSFSMSVIYYSNYGPRGVKVGGTIRKSEVIGSRVNERVAQTATKSLDVSIATDTPAPKLGDTVTLSAQATGGVPPFTYSWTGPVTGAAAQLAFTADKPGMQDFTVTVSDSKGATATASASVTIEAPTVTIQRTTTGPVVLGLPYGFQAQLSAAGKPLPGAFVYRWEPHPAVTYSPHEGASTQTIAVFTRPGTTLVWVDVLRQEGPVLVTVAESEQIEIDVVSPELSLAANPSTPFTGQEVRINVTMNPAIQDKYVTFWWEIQGNALNAGPVVVGDAYSRAYTYKPKDTAPVTVTVHSKSKDGGDDLGQKSIAVTAKLYQVKIGEPRLMGPPPRVWSEQAKGLVEVPRGIGTFQEFFVNASISPPPPDSPLRYDWKSQPEGCSIYSPGSQETRSSASQAGTFNISVTIRDSQNIVLGSGERTVSIVAPAPELKKAEPVGRQEALDLLKQAQSLYQQDKLNEALKMAEGAVNSDPANSDASRFAEELKEELQQIKQSLKTVEDLAVNGKLDEAVVELEKVKKPHPGYEDVLQFESTLQDLKKNAAERTKKAEEEEVQAAEAVASAAAAGREKATDLLKQAQSLYQQDKLLEALEMADAAVNSDPANSETGRYAKDLRAELEQIIQSLNSVKDLVNQGLLSEASAELQKLVKPHPLFAKFAEYESWLQGLTKSAEEKKRVEDEEAPAAEASASEAAAKLKQAQDLIKQNRFEEAHQLASEAARLDPSNLDASDCERSLRAHLHILKAQSLGKQGQFDEAYAEVALAKKIDPGNQTIAKIEQWLIQQREYLNSVQKAADLKKAETAKQQAATQVASEHLDQALSLGKAGRLDEAAAEVAEAKNDDPSHSRIPEFEQWIRQLRQQREEAANAADQKAVEDRAAEARAREAAAQSAAEEKSQQEPPPDSQGCSLSGDWSFSEEGGTMTLALRQTGTNLAGTITINDSSIGSSSLAVSGSMSGSDVRITGAKADFEISFSGTVSADCQTLNVSATMEGETHATPFRRR